MPKQVLVFSTYAFCRLPVSLSTCCRPWKLIRKLTVLSRMIRKNHSGPPFYDVPETRGSCQLTCSAITKLTKQEMGGVGKKSHQRCCYSVEARHINGRSVTAIHRIDHGLAHSIDVQERQKKVGHICMAADERCTDEAEDAQGEAHTRCLVDVLELELKTLQFASRSVASPRWIT